MTRFQKKEHDALDAYQREMNQFGLYVNKHSFGGSYNSDSTVFNLEMRTNPLPVKGDHAEHHALVAADKVIQHFLALEFPFRSFAAFLGGRFFFPARCGCCNP